MEPLKEEILELLEKDREFRYAVAGYLGLSEIMKRLDDIAEEQVSLREEQTKIWKEIRGLREEQVSLREDFNEMLEEMRRIDERLGRVERTLEKITLDIEEEARSILTHRIREELGLEMELGSLILPGLEINIYGATDDVCIIGEASVRAGKSVLERLIENVEKLRRRYPDKLRKNVIRVVYTSLPMPDLLERAREEGIWVLKATKDLVKPSLL